MGATTPEPEDAERDALNQIASQFKDDSRSERWSLAGWTKAAMPIGRPVSHVPVGEARCATVPATTPSSSFIQDRYEQGYGQYLWAGVRDPTRGGRRRRRPTCASGRPSSVP